MSYIEKVGKFFCETDGWIGFPEEESFFNFVVKFEEIDEAALWFFVFELSVEKDSVLFFVGEVVVPECFRVWEVGGVEEVE